MGYFKTWTVDSGLDHGLDCGLRYWRPLPAVECLYLSCNWRRSSLFTAGSIYDLSWSFRNLQRMILVRPGLADMMCTLTRRSFWLWSCPRLSLWCCCVTIRCTSNCSKQFHANSAILKYWHHSWLSDSLTLFSLVRLSGLVSIPPKSDSQFSLGWGVKGTHCCMIDTKALINL